MEGSSYFVSSSTRFSTFLSVKPILREAELRLEKMQAPEDKFALPETILPEPEPLRVPFKEPVNL